jgi:monoamine oxidase
VSNGGHDLLCGYLQHVVSVARHIYFYVITTAAGIAGLAAARQLLSFGFNVTVLESTDRIGGRIRTVRRSQRASATNHIAIDCMMLLFFAYHHSRLNLFTHVHIFVFSAQGCFSRFIPT